MFSRKGSLIDHGGLAGGGFVGLLAVILPNERVRSLREFGLIFELYRGFPTDERGKEVGRLC